MTEQEPRTLEEWVRRAMRPVKDPPVCECGRKATADGAYWVCRTPGCDGEGQILKARLRGKA